MPPIPCNVTHSPKEEELRFRDLKVGDFFQWKGEATSSNDLRLKVSDEQYLWLRTPNGRVMLLTANNKDNVVRAKLERLDFSLENPQKTSPRSAQ